MTVGDRLERREERLSDDSIRSYWLSDSCSTVEAWLGAVNEGARITSS